MDSKKEQQEGLLNEFQELVNNPAFQYMKGLVYERGYRTGSLNMQEMAERYIAEAAVANFIKEIESLSTGHTTIESVIESSFLEDENEVIDENENLFE